MTEVTLSLPIVPLTDDERELLRVLSVGGQIKHVARALGKSPNTAKDLALRARWKMAAANNTAAAVRAAQLGII